LLSSITIGQDGLIGMNPGAGVRPVATRCGLMQHKQGQVNV
jgi:hypothetical protein